MKSADERVPKTLFADTLASRGPARAAARAHHTRPRSDDAMHPENSIDPPLNVASPGKRLKVLFCGKEFPQGARCTQAAIEALRESSAEGADLIDVVSCDRSEVAEQIKDAHVAVPLMTRLDDAMLSHAKELRMVIQFGVGIEGVDEQACTSRKILLCFIPSEHTGNADSTAEMAVFHLLAAFRRVNQMADSIQTATLGDPWGRSISGSKVLVVGLGNVGGKVARLLKALGCKLHTVWRGGGVPDPDHPAALAEPSGNYASVDAALENNPGFDAVVLACNQTAENVGMVDRRFIERVGNRCPVVNVARGGLFDRDAVLWGLETGTLCYLASDVAWSEPLDPNDPVAKHPNAYFTPHVGGVTESSYTRMGRVVAEAAMKAMVGGRFGDDVYQKNGW